MTRVLVLIPAETPLPPPASALVVPYTTTLDVVVSLKGSDLPAVLCTDGIADDEADSVATAIRDRAGACIEVRLGSWDGESHSPISAACRGVISGFGIRGVIRAADLLGQ